MNIKETLKLEAINRTKQRVMIATTSNPVGKIFAEHEQRCQRLRNIQQIACHPPLYNNNYLGVFNE